MTKAPYSTTTLPSLLKSIWQFRLRANLRRVAQTDVKMLVTVMFDSGFQREFSRGGPDRKDEEF